MKSQTFVTTALLLFLLSCTGNKKEEQSPTGSKPETDNEPGYYLSVKGKDTVRFTLQKTENQISGKLDILPFEKDSRRGTIMNGEMKGDTLFAIYNSTQEGQQCECEIAFLRKGEDFILSNDIFGEMNYQYNAEYTKGSFKDKRHIKFDGAILKKVTAK